MPNVVWQFYYRGTNMKKVYQLSDRPSVPSIARAIFEAIVIAAILAFPVSLWVSNWSE